MELEKYALIKGMRQVFADPNKKHSIRGLAKAAGLSPSAAKACVDYLLARKMVQLEKVGRTHLIQADLKRSLTRHWKIVFFLEDAAKAGLVERVVKQLGSVLSITLYGSLARGVADPKSDVDLLVLVPGKKKRKILLLREEALIGREINPLIMTPQQWRELARKDKVFYEHVILDSINLYGQQKPVVL